MLLNRLQEGTEQPVPLQEASFGVCYKMLHFFCKSVMQSLISSAIICWGKSIRVSKQIKRLVLSGPSGDVDGRMTFHKMKDIINEPGHPPN